MIFDPDVPIRNYRCGYCEEEINLDEEIVLLRVGTFKQSEKHGRMYFQPKLFPDGALLKTFHFYCLMTCGFEFAEAEKCEDASDCAFCPEDLVGEERSFEMELGQFVEVKQDTMWAPTVTEVPGGGREVARLCACWDCVELTLGEGDIHAFRRRVGLPPLADQRKWINEGIPKKVDRRPPARRPPRRSYAMAVQEE